MAGFDDENVIGLVESSVEKRFEGSWANDLAWVNTESNSEIEEYGIFGGYAKMREWVGARQANVVEQKKSEIRNRKFENTLVVPNEMLDRDKTKLLQKHVDGFVAGSIAYQWEDLVTELIANNGVCYDGHDFFDTDHQFGSETAQTNAVTVTEVPALNVTGAGTAPTALELAAVITGLLAHMLTFYDDKGRMVNGNARNFTVQVGTTNLFTALALVLTNDQLATGVDNPLKGWNKAGFKFKPLFLPARAAETTIVRLYRTDGVIKPYILQEEKGVQYDILGRGSDFEFDNDAIKLGVKTRRGAGYGEWKDAIQGTMS